MCFGAEPKRGRDGGYYYREEITPATRKRHHHHHHQPARASYHSHTSRHSHYGHSPRASVSSYRASGPVVVEQRTVRRYG